MIESRFKRPYRFIHHTISDQPSVTNSKTRRGSSSTTLTFSRRSGTLKRMILGSLMTCKTCTRFKINRTKSSIAGVGFPLSVVLHLRRHPNGLTRAHDKSAHSGSAAVIGAATSLHTSDIESKNTLDIKTSTFLVVHELLAVRIFWRLQTRIHLSKMNT